MTTKKTFSKSSLIVKLAIALLVAIAAIGLYIVTPKAAPALPKSEVSLTQAPDFNACNVIKIDDIKNTFYGDLITSTSQGVRAGVNASNGTIGDSCGFSLATDKSANNSLAVQVYPYTATVNGDNHESLNASWSEVATSDPKAYFGQDLDGDTIVYKLRVIPGGKNVLFELRQPLEEAAFDEPSALDFLVGLAAKADLSVIDLPTAER